MADVEERFFHEIHFEQDQYSGSHKGPIGATREYKGAKMKSLLLLS